VHRPLGQIKPAHAEEPALGPSRRLDFELEVGAFVGAGNALGEAVPIGDAEQQIFGLVLFNDWSARDIQGWEYQPLGPFLSKSFASTISPWIVTLDALAPFRGPSCAPRLTRSRCPTSIRRPTAAPAPSPSNWRSGCRPRACRPPIMGATG
jgi:fumarylacetoacetase